MFLERLTRTYICVNVDGVEGGMQNSIYMLITILKDTVVQSE